MATPIEFILSIWSANDASKPANAVPCAGTTAGQAFYYAYNQSSVEVKYDVDTTYTAVFTVQKGNPDDNNNFEFRWINALEDIDRDLGASDDSWQLSAVRLNMKAVSSTSVTVEVSSTEEIQLSATEVEQLTTGTIDFQVWVEETNTNSHFMCDPKVDIEI